MVPRIGLTIGDPAGVGPEIVLKALTHRFLLNSGKYFIFGDLSFLKRTQATFLINHPCSKLKLFKVKSFDDNRLNLWRENFIPVLDIPISNQIKSIKHGLPTALGGKAAGEFIFNSTKEVIKNHLDAMVTAPINKQAFKMGGWGRRFPGHTEMLASLTGSRNVAPMMVYKSFRAISVTSHISLRQVPKVLNKNRILKTLLVSHEGLIAMGVRNPRIAVCGLNPHAGDGGILGTEEEIMIKPAIVLARDGGLNVHGPFSSDILWPMVFEKEFDVGVAMYHDQSQIPIKLKAFHLLKNHRWEVHGVNVTLGLPIIRTSPAHGTAYDIAGKGIASEGSMVDAIKMALKMVKHKIQ